MQRDKRFRRLVTEIEKQMIADGKLVAAGFVAFDMMFLEPASASEREKNFAQWAFFSGAQHLYASMLDTLDEGTEPTNADLDRVEKIHNELEDWRKRADVLLAKPGGRA